MNVEEGARILLKHINQEHDIFVIVDSDADGYTSAALLINYLFLLFPEYTVSHVKYQIHTGK
jgi:single-stranded-DNA-specific exonuclease